MRRARTGSLGQLLGGDGVVLGRVQVHGNLGLKLAGHDADFCLSLKNKGSRELFEDEMGKALVLAEERAGWLAAMGSSLLPLPSARPR